MSNYLLAFRGRLDADSPAAQEAVWAKWFQDLGPAILDMGAPGLGGSPRSVAVVWLPTAPEPIP
jgi:hypothetical protein